MATQMGSARPAYNSTRLWVALLLVASFFFGAAFQFTFYQYHTGAQTITETTSATSSSNSSAPYVLNLEITTNNMFNGTVGDQPAYYVVGPSGLESSANITIPAHRTIELIITNFDQGNATLPSPRFADVTGTQTGIISIYGNSEINSSEGQGGINITGSLSVSSVPTSVISHTFTVPALGLNIPVASQSTVIAYFASGAAGNYLWLCESPCGSGPTGLGGAMSTPGWMTGTLTVG